MRIDCDGYKLFYIQKCFKNNIFKLFKIHTLDKCLHLGSKNIFYICLFALIFSTTILLAFTNVIDKKSHRKVNGTLLFLDKMFR